MICPPTRSASIAAHLTEPGKDSPYRTRSVEENLDLFVRMKNGEFPDGTRVLRAKIDMASQNLNMRDPVMYRILHATHHRTGDEWCIYPMYDYAHGQSDSIEHVTHSMCTLEFADHQPLYRWYIEQLGIFPSQQIEFDRLNITYTLLSKRKLLQLVQEKRVSGWDDPRMPTLCGIRRRGFTAEAIRTFVQCHGRVADQWDNRHRDAGALSARRSEPPRLARHGRAASAEGGDRQLPGGQGGVRRSR